MKIKPSIYEVGVSLIVAEAFFLYGTNNATRVHDLAGVTTTVSGILFGFLLTSIAMLTTMPEHRLIQNMRKTRHLESLITETLTGCALHFLTLVCSLASAISEGIVSRSVLTVALATLALAIIKTALSGNKLVLVSRALHSANQ